MSEHDRLSRNLLTLAILCAGGHRWSLAYLGKKIGHKTDFFPRLSRGESIDFTATRYDKDLDWFSANWPEQVDWPVAIDRPKTCK